MCCCGKPNVNGTPGYSWDGKSFSTRPVSPPALAEGDTLLRDEPGRCGGLDCHSHHFRLVKESVSYILLVKHGGGEERIRLGVVAPLLFKSLPEIDSNARFWLLHTLYSEHREAKDQAAQWRDQVWRNAAAEKRIKTRQRRGMGIVEVWIEPTRQRARAGIGEPSLCGRP